MLGAGFRGIVRTLGLQEWMCRDDVGVLGGHMGLQGLWEYFGLDSYRNGCVGLI